MFELLIKWLPESRAMRIRGQILAELKSNLFDELATHDGIDEFVSDQLVQRNTKLGRRATLYLARSLASAISDRADSAVRNSSEFLAKVSKAKLDSDYLIEHEYSWEQEFAERVTVQCWGRLGFERKSWLMSDSRSSTGSFGIDSYFSRLFVHGDDPLYVLVDSLETPLRANVFRIIETTEK